MWKEHLRPLSGALSLFLGPRIRELHQRLLLWWPVSLNLIPAKLLAEQHSARGTVCRRDQCLGGEEAHLYSLPASCQAQRRVLPFLLTVVLWMLEVAPPHGGVGENWKVHKRLKN